MTDEASLDASARLAAPRPPDRADLRLGTKDRFEIGLYGDLYFSEVYQAARAAEGMPNVLQERGYDAQLDPFRAFMASADANIVNLETPLTRQAVSPFAGKKKFVHAGDPERTLDAVAKVNVQGVLLGNNHMLDHGVVGLADTLDALDAAGMKWTGAGRDSAEALLPLRVFGSRGSNAFTVAILSAWQYTPGHETKFAFYATPTRPGVANLRWFTTAIARCRQENPQALIVASPHWSENYVWRYMWQDEAAAAFFAAGADIVIAHGAHVLQEIGRVGRSWIVHSIGNFIFLSAGRHAKYGSPPYSLIARLIVAGGRRFNDYLLRLYPIVTNNELTDFHSRYVDDREFADVMAILKARSPALASGSDAWTSRDEHGHYLEFRVR